MHSNESIHSPTRPPSRLSESSLSDPNPLPQSDPEDISTITYTIVQATSIHTIYGTPEKKTINTGSWQYRYIESSNNQKQIRKNILH